MKVSQSSKNSKTTNNKHQTSLVDNRSKSSAFQSSDSNFEKFVVPIVETRGRTGARSVARIQHDKDSNRSENESSYMKYNELSNSENLAFASQTDVDAGYNTEERAEIKKVPNFLAKCFELVSVSTKSLSQLLISGQNPSNHATVNWCPDGIGFTVYKSNEFADKVLPKYFKHNNFSSFVRQLNMYNFVKSRNTRNQEVFIHPNFLRNKKTLLTQINKKMKQKIERSEPLEYGTLYDKKFNPNSSAYSLKQILNAPSELREDTINEDSPSEYSHRQFDMISLPNKSNLSIMPPTKTRAESFNVRSGSA